MLQNPGADTISSGVCPGYSSSEWQQAPKEPSDVGQWFGAEHRELLHCFLQFLEEK